MIEIKLSDEDQEILAQVLRNALAILELEIHHTDHAEFKILLKHRRSVLSQLLARLPRAIPAMV
jgi:RIO-like serine/threonine protein kinase